jgi:hypothetical protein
MPALNLRSFIGTIPVRDVRALPENAATLALNTRVVGGSLKPVNEIAEIVPSNQAFQADAFQIDAFQQDNGQLANLDPTTRSVFRIPFGTLTDLDSSVFLEFADPDTDVARSPTVNDSFERYYWASPSTGLQYNTRARIFNGDPPYNVGVPAPTAAIGSITPAGGSSGINVTRSYVVTFVSTYGEEGQPSPPREQVGQIDDTWTLATIPQPGTPPAGQVPLTHINIYRTVTAASGATTFFRVGQIAVGTTTFADNITDTVVTGNTQLRSTLWAPPPDMDGLIAMPNGIFVGFKGNTLFFSENFRPHAWPAEYQTTVQYPIVGLGVVGNTCVVCTQGHPAAVSGVRSDTMSLVTNTLALPCLSRGSIVSTLMGVVYASENALVMFTPAGPQKLGPDLFDRYAWRRDYNPAGLRACLVDGHYVASLGDGTGFMFDPQRTDLGVSTFDGLTSDAVLFSDVWTGRGLVVQTGPSMRPTVYEFMPVTGKPARMVWRSKEFQSPYPANFAAGEVFYDPYTNAEPLGPDEDIGRLKVFADGRKIYDELFRPSSSTFRLPSGFRAEVWQIEIEARVRIHAVHLATTVAELRNV